MDGIIGSILNALASRPTLILYEPLAASVIRRSRFQEVSPKVAEEFVKRWSKELARGWVDKFFPDLPAEEREELARKVQQRLLEGL